MKGKFTSILLVFCLVMSCFTICGAMTTGAGAATASKSVKVGVISYIINELGASGYKIHYWGGADGAKDVALTSTGKTEQKSVGSAYWSGAEQTFTMYTANIPADATGWKVHNGDRWFGNDATSAHNAAYIFNYSGDKALYETVTTPEEPATVAPTTQPSTNPTISDGYYLIGSPWTVDGIDQNRKFSANPNANGERELTTSLTKGQKLKVVEVKNGAIKNWYGPTNNYIADDNHSGEVKIYFKTTYNSDWEDFGGYFYIEKVVAGDATDFYICGDPSAWDAKCIKSEYRFSYIGGGEYSLNINLKLGQRFKVIGAKNGAIEKWYPEGNSGTGDFTVTADYAGAKTIYFKPTYTNAWASFGGYFYIEKNATPVTYDYYLIGSAIGWGTSSLSDNYKFQPGTVSGEYVLTGVILNENNRIKVVRVSDGEIQSYFPEGSNSDYRVDAAHTGIATIYFCPDGNSSWANNGSGGYFNVVVTDEIPTEPVTEKPTEPVTEPTTAPPAGSVTLKFAAPTGKAARNTWTTAEFCYGNKNTISDSGNVHLTMTDTGETYYGSDTFGSSVVVPGAWKVFSLTLTPAQAQAVNSSYFAGFRTANDINRTRWSKDGNILRAGEETYSAYSSQNADISQFDGKTFIFGASAYGAMNYQSYLGFWASSYVTVKTAAPMADTTYSRWNDVSFYYGSGTFDSTQKLRMVNTGELTKVSGLSSSFNLKNGRWAIFALTVPYEVSEEINAASSVGFCKTDAQNRTNNTSAYSVLKAKTNILDGAYNNNKRTLQALEGQVFVINGKTKTDAGSVATYTGAWKTREAYTAGNSDTITVYFAAPKGASGTTVSWNTGVELYYGSDGDYKNSSRLEMTALNRTKSVEVTDPVIKSAVASGNWSVYSVTLDTTQIKAIDESGRVGFIKKGSWERTSYSMKMDVTRAGTADAPGYGKKETIETRDGMIFVISGACNSDAPKASYTGAWDFYTQANQ